MKILAYFHSLAARFFHRSQTEDDMGLLATWIPAQRALSLDPLTLLREE